MADKELWSKIGPEAPLLETALHTFVHVEQPGKIGQHVETATANLDNGEREVIVLGTSLQEEVVLVMDDQAGRKGAGLPRCRERRSVVISEAKRTYRRSTSLT